MQPPQWVVDRIEALHPVCRLGYAGGDEFAICELWRVREAPTTMIGTPFLGRVYGSSYDPLERVPLQIMSAPIAEVMSGAVIEQIRAALTSFKDRAIAMRQERGREEEAALQEMAEEMGDRYWHECQRTDAARGEVMPDKMISPDDLDVTHGEWGARNSRANRYVDELKEIPGGAIK